MWTPGHKRVIGICPDVHYITVFEKTNKNPIVKNVSLSTSISTKIDILNHILNKVIPQIKSHEDSESNLNSSFYNTIGVTFSY
jgi:hypothetical protein